MQGKQAFTGVFELRSKNRDTLIWALLEEIQLTCPRESQCEHRGKLKFNSFFGRFSLTVIVVYKLEFDAKSRGRT